MSELRGPCSNLQGFIKGSIFVGILIGAQSIAQAHGGDGHTEPIMSHAPRSKGAKVRRSSFSSSLNLGFTQAFEENAKKTGQRESVAGPLDAHYDDPHDDGIKEESHDEGHERGASPYNHEEHGSFTSVGARLNYSLTPEMSLHTGLAARLGIDIEDPDVTAGYRHSINRKSSGQASVSVSLPLSKESRELEKVTTLTPGYQFAMASRRWLFGASGSIGVSFHQPTRESQSPSGGTDNHKASFTSVNGASRKASEAGESDGHGETHDRERLRISTGGSAGYRFTRKVTFSNTLSFARVNWDSSRPTWETEYGFVHLSYRFSSFTGSGALSVRHRDFGLEIPNEPIARAGVQYDF